MFYGQYSWLDKSDKSKHLRVFPVSLVLHSVLSCVFLTIKLVIFNPAEVNCETSALPLLNV